jgi:acyl-CoA thioester hydrolase
VSIIFKGTVKKDWVDYNGHMADFAYGIVFSDAVTAFMDEIGVDEAYRKSTRCTVYTLDARITYLKECHEGQSFYVVHQVMDADTKRYHAFMRMVDDASGEDVAWSEQLLMHMQQADGALPKAKTFPEHVQSKVDHWRKAQRGNTIPEWVGSRIGIRRK